MVIFEVAVMDPCCVIFPAHRSSLLPSPVQAGRTEDRTQCAVTAAAGALGEGTSKHLSGNSGDLSLAEDRQPHQIVCGLCPQSLLRPLPPLCLLFLLLG